MATLGQLVQKQAQDRRWNTYSGQGSPVVRKTNPLGCRTGLQDSSQNPTGFLGQDDILIRIRRKSPDDSRRTHQSLLVRVKGKRGEGHCKRNKRNQTPFRLEMPPLDPRAEGGHQGRTFQLRRLRPARQSVALAATLAAVKMAYLSNFTKRSRKNWGSPRP